MLIREATLHDIEAMSRVLIASITELCERDHGGVAANIARWNANKAPEGIRQWFANPANHLFVAEKDGAVVSVGSFNDDGEIQCNYVAPEARFSGFSKAMLAYMERTMRERGFDTAHLVSTATAHDFYEAAGWHDCGTPQARFGVHVQPMAKSLHEDA